MKYNKKGGNRPFEEMPTSTTRRASTLPAHWYIPRLPRSLGSTSYLRNDSRSLEGKELVRYIPCNENITCFGGVRDLTIVTLCLLTALDGFGIGRFIESATESETVGRFMPGTRHNLMGWKLYMICEADIVRF